MRATLIALPVLALGGSTLVVAGAAEAAAHAPTTVTIKADGTDMSGTVQSPAPRKCAKDRKVIVMKQKGARGGGDDENFASDIAGKQGDKFTWSTGNTGTEGRFYAKVKKTVDCRADTSPTIKVQRPDQRALAAARQKRANVRVTIAQSMTGFSGIVASRKPKTCAKERLVTVYSVGTGGAADTSVGSATTTKDGDTFTYSVNTIPFPGDYYAKVKRSNSCKGDVSKTITVSGPTR